MNRTASAVDAKGKSAAVSKSGRDSSNIQVAVRCRPISPEEKKAQTPTVVTCDMENSTVKLVYGPAGAKQNMKTFTFDKVFGMYSRQDEIFELLIKPVVEEAISGFNCTVFAYGIRVEVCMHAVLFWRLKQSFLCSRFLRRLGPTGTGKTHTIEGQIDDPDLCGLIPRTAAWIFGSLASAGADFAVKISYLEICKSIPSFQFLNALSYSKLLIFQ